MKNKKYKVTITETLSREVIVEAPTAIEAKHKVQKDYASCKIVLDADDFISPAEIHTEEIHSS